MADPKYANLPGIDVDSPDVYETNDLPEDDQAASVPTELSSDSVEKLSVDTKSALKKFKGKEVNASDLDFSDRISQTKRTGYGVERAEYGMAEYGPNRIETPQQKCQRLQYEIRELAEEVHSIQENVKADSSSENASAVPFGKQLEYLQHQLTDLHLEKLLGPTATVDMSDPQGSLHKRLLTQLDAYVPSQPGNAETKQQSKVPTDHVMYELYYRPEQAQFSRNARLASLEERLERLEAAIGQGYDKLGVLTAETDNKSLLGAVSVMNSKLSLLDPGNLDQVEARLQNVLHKLGQISDKKPSEEDEEKQNKISELYNMVKKWESIAESVPQVVDRLVSLKELHEQALQFSQALSALDSAQQEISTSIMSHGEMVKQLQVTFKENTDALKSNCESIDSRIKNIKK
ncbi:hypothetical protein ScPMuIL_015287 [Solemya velum]